jgi:WD40 repeat protein
MSYWIQGHEGEVNDVKMSQDGEFLVSGCSDGTVKVFDTALGGKSVCAWSVSSPVIRLDVYRGSDSGGSASGGLYGDGSPADKPDKGLGSTIFSSIRAAVSQTTGALGSGKNESDARSRARASSSSSSSSGAYSSAHSRCWVLAGCSDGMCKLWQVGSTSPVQQLQCHTNKVLACNLFGESPLL